MANKKLQEILIRRSAEPDSEGREWDGCEIFPHLYVGSLQAALDVENLRKYSVSGVLTVANQLEVNLPEDILHLQIDIADHPCANILEVLSQSLDFIDRVLKDQTETVAEIGGNNSSPLRKRCILVHCASGISRSVSVCSAWLMIRQQITFDQSMELIRQRRPRANPNLGFRQQLTYLERHGNQITAANEEYISQYGHVNILDVIKQQRDEINEIYSQVDCIENELKQTSEVDMSLPQLSTWEEKLNSLISHLDQITQRHVQNPLRDPPSISIRKSAASKIVRLLEDIEANKIKIAK
jgi:protein-tyrosine phosphatase